MKKSRLHLDFYERICLKRNFIIYSHILTVGRVMSRVTIPIEFQCIFQHHHHYHHVMTSARVSLTLSVSLQHTCYNIEVVCVSIRGTDFYFGVSI